jgi:Zn-dependent peptidase ImmA (M78 family)
MSIQFARSFAEKLAERYGSKVPPINVERIAKSVGLRLVYADLGSDVSGLLVTKPPHSYVCIHEKDVENRQRFTIAHEIGHFMLRHQFETGTHVHVDRGHFISQRGPQASAGIDLKEIEANQFAACLLMPAGILRNKVGELGSTPLLDRDVSKLAQGFCVSEQAMTIRLTSLGLL